MFVPTLSSATDIRGGGFDTRINVHVGIEGHAFVEATDDGAVALSLTGAGEMCISPATARALAAALQAVACHIEEEAA